MPQPQPSGLTQTSGAWTPQLLVAGADPGDIVYASRAGSWVKTGKELRLDFSIVLVGKGASQNGYLSIVGWAGALGLSATGSCAGGCLQEASFDVSVIPGEYFGLAVGSADHEIRIKRMQGGTYQDALAVQLMDATVIAGSIAIVQ